MLQEKFCLTFDADPLPTQSTPIPPVPSQPPRTRGTVVPVVLPVVCAETFHDLIGYIDSRTDWPKATRAVLKSGVSRIAWSIALIEARRTGRPLDPDRRRLDLRQIRCNAATINQALECTPYGLAGFGEEKSYRNAKSSLRRVLRELGKTDPLRAPAIPPCTPYAPLMAMTDRWNASAARLFVARQHEQERPPMQVTRADLLEHGVFLRARRIGVKVDATLAKIAKLWEKTAAHVPEWPQTSLHAVPATPPNPPLSAYLLLQGELTEIRQSMEGSAQDSLLEATEPRREATIKHHFACIRTMLGVAVHELGMAPHAIPSLRLLHAPEIMDRILVALRERGRARQQRRPAAERDDDRQGRTRQMMDVAGTMQVLARHYFQLPPEELGQIRKLVKAVRKKRGGMTRKNRRRLGQFDDHVKLGLLLGLPYRLMREALELLEPKPPQAPNPREAARLARAAIFFAIENRIPLRIKNLQSCRIGHNLMFSGADSQIVWLKFRDTETKNWNEVEFFVGPRLCGLLKLYIDRFLPLFAVDQADYAANQWLFPAGDGKAGPLSNGQVRKIINDTVAERVGAEFNPHLFRALAVKHCLEHSPGALEHCRLLLGNKTLQIILDHYAPVERKQAALYLDGLISAEEDRLGALTALAGRSRPRIGTQA